MLVVFPSFFVAGTKVIYGYNFVAPLTEFCPRKESLENLLSKEPYTLNINFG